MREHFKDIHRTLEFDPKNPRASAVETVIDTRGLWTNEPQRDTHLKNADFLNVENYPEIRFRGKDVKLLSDHDARVTNDLTIHRMTRPATLHVMYLNQQQTPW